MTKLPKGWSAHDLGDLAQKIEGGGTPPRNEPSYWNGDIPWASVKDLSGVKLSTTDEFISESGLKNSSSKLIPSNTMIIASRMAVGRAVYFNRDVAINQDLKAFYPKQNTDWLFLLQWYLSQSEKIEGLATGSTVKGIRLEDLRLLPIDLPPLPEQQKIATILSSVDNVIEKTRAQIDKLKDLKAGMMQELLTKGIGHTEFKDSPVGRIPKGWSIDKLINLSINGINNGVFNDPKNVGSGYRLINVVNMYRGFGIQLDTLKRLEIDEKEFVRNKVEKGDVFFTRSSLKLEGIAYCNINLSDDDDITYDGHLMRVRPDQSRVLPKYLAYYCLSDFARVFFMQGAKHSTMTTIGQADIAPLPVLVPSMEEQIKICKVLDSIASKISTTEAKLISNQQVKKALMQDLLTGKVRVKVEATETAE